MQRKIFRQGKNVEPNCHLCTMSKRVFLADDKMANISLDVKCILCHLLKENLSYLSYLDRTVEVVFYIISFAKRAIGL